MSDRKDYWQDVLPTNKVVEAIEKRLLVVVLIISIALGAYSYGYIKGSESRWNAIKSDYLEGIKIERVK